MDGMKERADAFEHKYMIDEELRLKPAKLPMNTLKKSSEPHSSVGTRKRLSRKLSMIFKLPMLQLAKPTYARKWRNF